ncbi:UNVERIFIED_CONTAM: hypothetical protein Sradi_4411400 [Sesamum radiatum]|uniref:CCHC-type domain-containing protein n=1 Tax=Sesamum radiatum TaxID=300843 RepID=A0AAW2NTI4_SESRA
MAKEDTSAKLNRVLQLTEAEKTGEAISPYTWSDNMDDTGHYLAGRLLTSKFIRLIRLKSSLLSSSTPSKVWSLRLLRMVLFCFNHRVDKNRALVGWTWSFKENILKLSRVNENENPLWVNLEWCALYVHVRDLPIRKMTKEFAEYIGNRIGKFMDVEHMDDHRNWSSTLRIWVKLSFTKPLRRFMKIRSTDNEMLLVSSYERLPNFCYLCGLLGHLSKLCEKRYEPDFSDPGEDSPFNAWFRATLVYNLATKEPRGCWGEKEPPNMGISSLSGQNKSSPANQVNRRGITCWKV